MLVIGLSCARNEDTLKDYTVAGEKAEIDTSDPKVSSTSPDDGSSNISVASNISITFSEAMKITDITTNNKVGVRYKRKLIELERNN